MFVATGIEKRYGGVRALAGVDLEIVPGEVHALLGANGAGKSTLVKILVGAEQPSAGELRLAGEPVRFANVGEAGDRGVAIVSQELNLFADFDVLHNLFLLREPLRGGLVDRREMRRRALPVLDAVGLDPALLGRRLGSLRLAEQQLVEIARALLREPKILFLDEPTSALQAGETQRLLDVVRSLRARGVAIVYVSHFLEDVFAIADTVTILRNGLAVVARAPTRELTIQATVRHMLGADAARGAGARATRAGSTAAPLRLEGASVRGLLRDATLEAAPGEVVGLAGLEGSGPQVVMDVIFGRRRLDAGRIVLPSGRGAPRDMTAAVRAGIAYVPADRKRFGLMLEKPIFENVATVRGGPLRAMGVLLRRRELLERARHWTRVLKVKTPSPELLAGHLSGGNQQKVVFAKWLEADPGVVLLDDPSRGVDVGAKLEMHAIIERMADEGRVVLYASSDLEEMAELCDRVIVFFGGEVRGELRGGELTEHGLLEAINTGRFGAREEVTA